MSWTPAAAHPVPARVAPARVTPERRTTGPRPSTAHSAGIRLTRRGRLVLLGALIALLLSAFSLGRVGSQAAPSGARAAVPLAQTTVHAGETLWTLAQRIAPGSDPRPVVRQIQELNHLEDVAVQAGQLLVLPR